MSRRISWHSAAIVSVCITLATAAGAPAQAGQTAADKVPTLTVDTRLVVVPVVVRDKKGVLLRSLRREDFTITENGKPQTIRYFDKEGDAPLTVGLLVDVSGSQRNVLDEERTASSAFLDNLLRPERDKAFVVQFGRQADLLADVTGSLPRLEAGLKRLDADTGRPQFSQAPPDNGGGNDSPSGPDDRQQSGQPGRGGRRHGGAGRGGGTVLYDAICEETGGRVFEVTKKQPVAEIYKQISDELRSEYRLGFTPVDASDGYHHITVDLPKDPKSSIQARDGYYVGTTR